MRILFVLLIVFAAFGCIKKEEPAVPAATAEMEVSASVAAPEAAPTNIAGVIPAVPTEDGEAIISSGSWGFSAFDPASGVTEYYTSSGGYLGNRSQ